MHLYFCFIINFYIIIDYMHLRLKKYFPIIKTTNYVLKITNYAQKLKL